MYIDRHFLKWFFQLNTIEVIDAAMEKVWFNGEEDVFIFLLNMIKKDVISVNYQVSFIFCIYHTGPSRRLMGWPTDWMTDLRTKQLAARYPSCWKKKPSERQNPRFGIWESRSFSSLYLISGNVSVLPLRLFVFFFSLSSIREIKRQLVTDWHADGKRGRANEPKQGWNWKMRGTLECQWMN